VKTGDILELEVGSDLAYLQLTHNHFASGEGFWYGWFCRVFSRRFSKRPTSRQLDFSDGRWRAVRVLLV